ncbi:hypothetical protein IT570_11890 [Candidatus Sumerlaeota bacterium]|nr:hypothetical protein [Candidatus Sumerlaeota bacterium]
MRDQKMSDQDHEDQQKSSREVLTRREDAWEDVLVRASRRTDEDSPASSPRSNDAWRWVKAALPLAVVLVYVVVKSYGGWTQRSGSWPETVRQAKSLTGVKPAAGEAPTMDRPTRAFVAEMEKLLNENNLVQVKKQISGADNAIKGNPIVQAIYVVARTRQGELNTTVERQLMGLEAQLAVAEGDFPNLLQEVRVARADQILNRSSDGDTLSRNTDTILNLLGPVPKTNYALDVRLRAARRFEQVGDGIVTEGEGVFRTDILKVREARAYYQTGLRFIVADNAWLQLKPITPRASPDVERIVERIRDANRKINGVSLPFTESDSTTWTGKKGDPVHDIPAGGG